MLVTSATKFPRLCTQWTFLHSATTSLWLTAGYTATTHLKVQSPTTQHWYTQWHFSFSLMFFFSYPDLFPNKTYVIYWNDDISIQRMATLHRVAHISGSVHLCDSNRWILPSCIVSCFSPGWQITISNIILCINRTNIFLQVIVCNSWLLEGKETNNGICCLRFLRVSSSMSVFLILAKLVLC